MADAAPAPDFSPLPGDAEVVLGLSGGLDSSVLLDLLSRSARMQGRLRALHVHHGLQPAADAWAVHCRDASAALGIPLRIVRVEVERASGLGPEAAAREARHAAFAAELREGEVLALAHHRDDQAETFLLRALRASGPDGLAAMRPWRCFGRGWLWRPLLGIPRMQLLAHARANGLAWVEDPSNASIDPDRNFLRHRILPVLRERWPHADAALARSAALSADATNLLDTEDELALAAVRTDDPSVLDRAAVGALPRTRRARVLRRWIAGLGLPPIPARGIARIETDLLEGSRDGAPEFAWAGARVCAWRNMLHAGIPPASLPLDWTVEWDGATPLPLPTGGVLCLAPANAFARAVLVHARRGGERIRLPDRTHSHALKHVLQDLGVPPWERAQMPLLTGENGEVLAAGDAIQSAGFAQWLHDNGTRLIWQRTPALSACLPGQTTTRI